MSSLQSHNEIRLRDQLVNTKLLNEIIDQLCKDASLAGISFDGSNISSADQLVQQVYAWLLKLINNDFGSYLNFLYRADISESTLKAISENEPEQIIRKVTLLVLDRELKKIQLRNKNR